MGSCSKRNGTNRLVSSFVLFNIKQLSLNLNCVLKSNFLFLLVVLECKTLYKSIRDAARYRQKKAAGKSGDSGDEALNDDSENTSSEVSDSFAFLLPTSSKFPRKTLTFGGSIHGTSDDKSIDSGRATISPNSSRNDDMYTDEELKKVIADEEKYNAFIDENDCSSPSVYSYVSQMFLCFFICVSVAPLTFCLNFVLGNKEEGQETRSHGKFGIRII